MTDQKCMLKKQGGEKWLTNAEDVNYFKALVKNAELGGVPAALIALPPSVTPQFLVSIGSLSKLKKKFKIDARNKY